MITFNKIIKLSPLIYALLVFIGYLNYNFYHNPLGIDIFNYLNTGELLMSFLSITIPLVWFSVIVFLFFISNVIENARQIRLIEKDQEYGRYKLESVEEKTSIIYNDSHKQILLSLCNFKKHILRGAYFRSFQNFLGVFINSLEFLIKIVLWISFFVYIYFLPVFLGEYSIYPDQSYKFAINLFLLLFSPLFLMMILSMLRRANNTHTIKNYTVLKYILLIIFFVITLDVYQKIRIHNLLHYEPESIISFEYFDNKIVTDNNLVLIGRTSQSLFLRNRKENITYVYQTIKLKNYSIKALSKKN